MRGRAISVSARTGSVPGVLHNPQKILRRSSPVSFGLTSAVEQKSPWNSFFKAAVHFGHFRPQDPKLFHDSRGAAILSTRGNPTPTIQALTQHPPSTSSSHIVDAQSRVSSATHERLEARETRVLPPLRKKVASKSVQPGNGPCSVLYVPRCTHARPALRAHYDDVELPSCTVQPCLPDRPQPLLLYATCSRRGTRRR